MQLHAHNHFWLVALKTWNTSWLPNCSIVQYPRALINSGVFTTFVYLVNSREILLTRIRLSLSLPSQSSTTFFNKYLLRLIKKCYNCVCTPLRLPNIFFFLSGSLLARIHLIRWISGVSGVQTPAPAYNNALSYQLSYAHGTMITKYYPMLTLLIYLKKWKVKACIWKIDRNTTFNFKNEN